MTSLTYSRYLQLDELLALQRPSSAEHDEILFIVVHQVYELWFKQILHELAQLKRAFTAGDHAAARLTLNRILKILKTLVVQIDVLETMTPVSFLAFRARLESSSGFQSIQFREVEFELGYRRMKMLEFYDDADRDRLTRRAREPSVWDAFLAFLGHRGYGVPKLEVAADLERRPTESPPIQVVLLEIYKSDPATTQLCELLVDLDEGLQEWRYRHVKMVERTIGTKGGTGGSAGAEYLRGTLFAPVFPDLWAIRQRL